MIHPLAPLLLLACPTIAAHPAPASEASLAVEGRPRLVVLVVVDQLVPEQLERLAPRLDGGLGRFREQGLVFRRAELGYARTETGPGHATLATGTFPSTHGIVGNRFFDREQWQLVYCVGDESTYAVTSEGPSAGPGDVSPRNLRVPALGDLLRSELGSCRVVSIAGKDRAAVAMGGHDPEIALWWDRSAGGFESSTYYGERLPAWVLGWNTTWPERYAEMAPAGWTPLDEDLAHSGTAADERPGESAFGGDSAFPHELPPLDSASDPAALARGASVAFGTPLVDRFVVSLASTAVVELELGSREEPDVLALGLSACDVVGHSFGPYSREVTDVLLRTDDALAELFDLLDERLGTDGWIACLSADHGVLELPEALVEQGVDAGRVPGTDMVALREAILTRLDEAYGSDLGFDYVDGVVFDPARMAEGDVDPEEVWQLTAEIARQAGWVSRAFTYSELRDTRADDPDPLRRLMAKSVAEGRGPDVSIVQVPWKLLAMPTGTSHGSPYSYDRRIPLVFLGTGFEAGERFGPADAVDAVPTLLGALGIDVPEHVEGRDLR